MSARLLDIIFFFRGFLNFFPEITGKRWKNSVHVSLSYLTLSCFVCPFCVCTVNTCIFLWCRPLFCSTRNTNIPTIQCLLFVQINISSRQLLFHYNLSSPQCISKSLVRVPEVTQPQLGHRNKTFFVKSSCILLVLECHFRSVITADGNELILISHLFKLSELLVLKLIIPYSLHCPILMLYVL